MRKKQLHFKKRHPVKRFFHSLHLKWSMFWNEDRMDNVFITIVGGSFLLLVMYIFIMYE